MHTLVDPKGLKGLELSSKAFKTFSRFLNNFMFECILYKHYMTLFKNGHKGFKGLKLFSKPSKPFWSTRAVTLTSAHALSQLCFKGLLRKACSD